jgi:hypothetical protein
MCIKKIYKMPHTYKLLLQEILLKIYYCKSHKLRITPTLLSNITP